MPAGWVVLGSIVAVAVLAAVGVVGSASLRTHRGGTQTKPLAAASQAPVLNAEQRGRVRASMGALPLAFEANQGQTDPQVKYMARGNGYTAFLTANETVFALSSSPQASSALNAKHGFGGAHQTASPRTKDRTAAIHMQLVGGNAQPQIAAGSQLPGHSSYFIGNDRSQWHADVPQYARVSYRDVYPGVNMAFYGVQKQLEFDFILAPGASAAPIRFGISGANRVATDHSGNLVLTSSAGDVLLHKPVAYQEKDGARESVDASFVLQANQVRFELGNYDRSRELVIDPSVSYATYLGGTAEDDGYGIAVDGSGNVYVTGQTKSTNFPTSLGAYKTTNTGGFDVFVTKVSADGTSLIYSTYVGGSGDDSGNAIAVDASGNAFVAGGTPSSDFPTTVGAKQTTFGGGSLDAFVFELASSGGSLTYSTFLGGSGTDVVSGLALAKDNSGDVFVVGSTFSTDFPTTAGVLQTAIAGVSNGFVTKVNSTGSSWIYSTYLGGGTGDFASAVAVDSSNNAYVTGATQNALFKTTSGAFQTSCGTAASCNGGLSDAFVSVIKPDASGFVYSTFLGGSNADQGLAIAVDSSNDAYVTGLTQSNTDFPTKTPIHTFGGGTQDAFVTALNPTGSALLYSTYLGGSQADAGAGIAVDANKNVYVTGQTNSSDFPTVLPTQSTLKGGNDAFVAEIDSTGSQVVFSTYLGGSANEDSTAALANFSPVGAITVDSAGTNIYVTGNTFSTDFPSTVGAKQTASGGGTDAFVAKYATTNFTVSATALSPASVNPGSSATSTVNVSVQGGFSGSVALTCSVAPASTNAPTCGFSVASITSGTPSTLTVATTASTPGGSYTITVTGTSGALVHSVPLTLAVTAPDFTIAGSALSAVAQGGSATSTITITPVNVYTGTVNFTCSVASVSGGSPLPTCSIPTAVTGGAGTSTLTVKTTGTAHAMNQGTGGIFFAMWLPVVGLSLVGMRFSTGDSRRKKLLGFLLLGLVMAALFFLPGCGGSSSTTGGGGCSGCTPTGSYTVTVTGTDSVNASLTHAVTPALTLTVN
jgi:hypothetical protein